MNPIAIISTNDLMALLGLFLTSTTFVICFTCLICWYLAGRKDRQGNPNQFGQH